MRGIAAYKQTRVGSASPTQVVMMLFQETVHRLTRAAHSMDNENVQWRKDLHHAREIYLELLGALDREAAPQMCDNLHSLYQWCISELIVAGRNSDKAKILAVLKVSTTLLEGWQFVANGGQHTP
ncbi:MAG: flagellar export chaperone FliS [Myxococcota bacterium]